MKKKVRKILNIIVDVLVVFILIVSILTVVVSLTSRESGVPNLFGKAPIAVLTGSMNPTLEENDLLICEVTNDSSKIYEVGDIVTFKADIDGYEELNTHRIVEVVDLDGNPWKEGMPRLYRTQGDNNPTADEKLLSADDIVAKYTGTKYGGVGAIFAALRTQEGFFLIVLLPMILFFIYEAVRVVINVVGYNKEKAILAAQEVINASDLTEEQKKRAIEEYLAAQNAKTDKDKTDKDSESAEKSDDEEADEDSSEEDIDSPAPAEEPDVEE